jgi:hydrogenase nickel incorporation protein HypB
MTNRVQIIESILNANDQLAAQNRSEFDQTGVFFINLMASPGAGKTSLILETIRWLQNEMQIGVIEGDIAPVTIDSDKVVAAGMRAVQINTGGNCYLDANMLRDGLKAMDLDRRRG